MKARAAHDRPLALFLALLAAAGALWLGLVADWPAETAALLGRAMLGATGKADLTPLIAAYPPIPYILLCVVEPFARLVGIDAAGLLTALLMGGLVGAFAIALREARFDWTATVVFSLILCIHPFTLWAVTAGPQALLLLWGVYLFGMNLFAFRATGGINQLIGLTLSLPLLAFTSLHGALIAISAIPFLLLGVPPQLLQRAYGSVYTVLLFPLIFGIFSMCVIAGILLHDPWGFVSLDLLRPAHWSSQPWWMTASACAGAVIGVLVIAPGMVLRVRTRRPLQSAAVALLGTMVLAVVLASVTAIVANPVEALAPTVIAAAVVAARWPLERNRVLRTGALLGIGLFAASSVAFTNPAPFRATAAAIDSHGPPTRAKADQVFGRFLADKQDVMIDAAAHPAVIAARGSTQGLITATSPAFAVALLRRRIEARHIVARRHVAGISDDLLGRMFPDLYERGAPGYSLSHDRDGWRVWSRSQPEEAAQ